MLGLHHTSIVKNNDVNAFNSNREKYLLKYKAGVTYSISEPSMMKEIKRIHI